MATLAARSMKSLVDHLTAVRSTRPGRIGRSPAAPDAPPWAERQRGNKSERPGDRRRRPLRQTGVNASRYVIENLVRRAARGGGLRSACATLSG